MDFKNKYLVIAVRILFGLFMVFSGISGLLAGPNAESIPAPMVEVTQNLWASGIFQMIKVTEILAGLMLVVNFLPALAAIFLAPISIGVIVFNARLAPAFIPMGIILALLTAYLGYVYWDSYKGLFERK